MTNQHRDALDQSIGQALAPRCPHLGTQVDPDTWFTFPAAENYCHKASPSQPVSVDYQGTHCLAGQYGECPVYNAQRAKWVGSLPKEIKGKTAFPNLFTIRSFLIFGGVIGFLAVLAFVGVLIVPRFLNRTTPPQPTPTVATAEVTATAQPTSETPTPTATTTTNAITPTVATTAAVVNPNNATPTVTREPVFASVAFETNLRDGPSTENDVLARIPGGTTFLVLGRDTLGVWLFVEVDELGQGWVFADQIEEEIEILTLPVIYVGTAPTPTPSGSGSGGSSTQVAGADPTDTSLQTPPSRFRIDLDLVSDPISCEDNDQIVFYDVSLLGNSLVMERDTLRMSGTYDPDTGEFKVEGVIPDGFYQGVLDTIEGTMIYEDQRVTIEGIQTWTNTGEDCDYIWHVMGTSAPTS